MQWHQLSLELSSELSSSWYKHNKQLITAELMHSEKTTILNGVVLARSDGIIMITMSDEFYRTIKHCNTWQLVPHWCSALDVCKNTVLVVGSSPFGLSSCSDWSLLVAHDTVYHFWYLFTHTTVPILHSIDLVSVNHEYLYMSCCCLVILSLFSMCTACLSLVCSPILQSLFSIPLI